MMQSARQALVFDKPVEREFHPVRQAILCCLESRSGVNLQSLCEEIEANRGTVTHHLRVLQRQGTVQSVKTGRERRFFLSTRGNEAQVMEVIGRGPGGRIAAAVAANPGMNQKTLVTRLQISRKVFRRHMDELVAHGFVDEQREGRERRYFPLSCRSSVTEEFEDGGEGEGSSEQ